MTTITNAKLLGGKVNRNKITNFEGMVMPRHRFSQVSDADLNNQVLRDTLKFSNSGYREVKSMLGRERVSASLNFVVPLGATERRRTAA